MITIEGPDDRPTLFLACLLAAAACTNSRGNDQPDANTAVDAQLSDAEPADVQTADNETSDSQSADAETSDRQAADGHASDAGLRDAGPEPTNELTGTSLEGVAIAWDQDLVLCDAFHEGGTLEDAAAKKIVVRLPPATRPGLSRADLEGAQLRRGILMRTPFDEGQWPIDRTWNSSRLINWEKSGPPEATQLQATVEHDLGTAGRLLEALFVLRAGEDRSPVLYQSDEVQFILVSPQGDETFLDRCTSGPPVFEHAIAVLSASDGDQSIIVLREQNERLVFAGTASVYPTRTSIYHTDPSLFLAHLPLTADGMLAHTYSAQHHNWSEVSRVDYRNDRRFDFLFFAPLGRGGSMRAGKMIESVVFHNVNTPGTSGSLQINVVEAPTGNHVATTWNVTSDWRRVDSTALQRALRRECADGRVMALLASSPVFGDQIFQIGMCPRRGPLGFDIGLFVPVVFQPEPSLVGLTIPNTRIREIDFAGRAGIEIQVGAHSVHLRTSGIDPKAFDFRVVRGGETVIAQTYAIETTLEGHRHSHDEALRGADRNNTVELRLSRRLLMPAGGYSVIYAPNFLELTFGQRTYRVEAWDRMQYQNTHHNFDDELIADTHEVRIRWRARGLRESVVEVTSLRDQSVMLPETEVYFR